MTAMHRLQQAEVRVSALARAVALRRAGLTALAVLLLAFAVSRGWITPGFSDEVRGYVTDGLGAAATVGAGAWIHFGTTPARQELQPRNTAGQLLIPDPSQPPVGGLIPPHVDLNGALATAPSTADPFMEGGGANPDGAQPPSSG